MFKISSPVRLYGKGKDIDRWEVEIKGGKAQVVMDTLTQFLRFILIWVMINLAIGYLVSYFLVITV